METLPHTKRGNYSALLLISALLCIFPRFPFARLVHNAPSAERVHSGPFAKIEIIFETTKKKATFLLKNHNQGPTSLPAPAKTNPSVL